MVAIFKTNIQTKEQAERVKAILLISFIGGQVTIDMEDEDRVLRIKYGRFENFEIFDLLWELGIECEVLTG